MLDIYINEQKDTFKCGAYALEAIFSYYDVACKFYNIWNNIRCARGSGGEYSTSAKIVEYSIRCELNSTIYRAKNINEILDNLSLNNIPAILPISCRDENDKFGHFVVFKGLENEKYIFADSLSKELNRERKFEKDSIVKFAKYKSSEITGNIFIIFSKTGIEVKDKKCQYCNEIFPLVHWDVVNNLIESIICPYCDRCMKN